MILNEYRTNYRGRRARSIVQKVRIIRARHNRCVQKIRRAEQLIVLDLHHYRLEDRRARSNGANGAGYELTRLRTSCSSDHRKSCGKGIGNDGILRRTRGGQVLESE